MPRLEAETVAGCTIHPEWCPLFVHGRDRRIERAVCVLEILKTIPVPPFGLGLHPFGPAHRLSGRETTYLPLALFTGQGEFSIKLILNFHRRAALTAGKRMAILTSHGAMNRTVSQHAPAVDTLILAQQVFIVWPRRVALSVRLRLDHPYEHRRPCIGQFAHITPPRLSLVRTR